MIDDTDAAVGADETGPPIYNLAGLRIQSPIALGAPLADGPFDWTVVVDRPREVPLVRPSTDVIAERTDSRFIYYSIGRVGDGIVARFFGLGEFHIPDSGNVIHCHAAPGTESEYLSLLLAGSVAAFLHASQGRLVLHASAVSWDDGAIAFAGPSGGGKTTIAAMLCRTGARLVTDDVLVLDARPGEESVWARRGGTELRVRAAAGELADASARRTVDGRLAVSPAYVDASEVPLQAVILPRPHRGATAIDGRRLGLGEAAHILGQSQRIEGWQDMKLIGQQFESAVSIAGRIPVVELTLPWAPSYDVTTAAQVVTACREKACLSEG